MKPKFKQGQQVRDDCGCVYRIRKVGRKYYDFTFFRCRTPYQVKIKDLDERANEVS